MQSAKYPEMTRTAPLHPNPQQAHRGIQQQKNMMMEISAECYGTKKNNWLTLGRLQMASQSILAC